MLMSKQLADDLTVLWWIFFSYFVMFYNIIHILTFFFFYSFTFSSILFPSNNHSYFIDNARNLYCDTSHPSLIHMKKI